MPNKDISKVVYGAKVLMDLTSDTVDPSKLLSGITAHDKTGAKIVGTYKGGEIKCAEGSFKYTNGVATIRGLSFKPDLIIVYANISKKDGSKAGSVLGCAIDSAYLTANCPGYDSARDTFSPMIYYNAACSPENNAIFYPDGVDMWLFGENDRSLATYKVDPFKYIAIGGVSQWIA